MLHSLSYGRVRLETFSSALWWEHSNTHLIAFWHVTSIIIIHIQPSLQYLARILFYYLALTTFCSIYPTPSLHQYSHQHLVATNLLSPMASPMLEHLAFVFYTLVIFLHTKPSFLSMLLQIIECPYWSVYIPYDFTSIHLLMGTELIELFAYCEKLCFHSC